jgi:hypothetical protein
MVESALDGENRGAELREGLKTLPYDGCGLSGARSKDLAGVADNVD